MKLCHIAYYWRVWSVFHLIFLHFHIPTGIPPSLFPVTVTVCTTKTWGPLSNPMHFGFYTIQKDIYVIITSFFEERKPFLGGRGAEQEQRRCPFGRQGLNNFIPVKNFILWLLSISTIRSQIPQLSWMSVASVKKIVNSLSAETL